MRQIVYLNQKALLDARLTDCLANYDYDWTKFNGITKLNPGHDGSYIREGTNVYPLKNDLIKAFGFQMPRFDPGFGLSFSEVTDLRLAELCKTRSDKRWLVLWSGGIDSMVIVTSILKNLSLEDRSNIDIACNRISIYENPRFFYDHIKPNFNLIDSSFLTLDAEILEKYYVIDGEPADQLYGGIASRGMPDSKTVLKDWRRDPDGLIASFSQCVNRPFAEWYYETAKENIESTDIPIENYYDFCWWLFFNASWAPVLLRPLQFQTDGSVEGMKSFLDNFITWFSTQEYQLWSMSNGLGVKYGANVGERKLASKRYIYEFDHDPYYFQFKTKMESTSRKVANHAGYFCILDDYSRLTLDRDLEEILKILPDHINLRR